MFGKSIESLKEELSRLQAQCDSRSMELIGKGVNSDQLVKELMPITSQMVSLRNQIRRKTPRSQLLERRNSVQAELEQCPDSDKLRKVQLQSELLDLNDSLNTGHRFSKSQPLTLKQFLIVVGIVAALVFLMR